MDKNQTPQAFTINKNLSNPSLDEGDMMSVSQTMKQFKIKMWKFD